jgi:hypothetical protein
MGLRCRFLGTDERLLGREIKTETWCYTGGIVNPPPYEIASPTV